MNISLSRNQKLAQILKLLNRTIDLTALVLFPVVVGVAISWAVERPPVQVFTNAVTVVPETSGVVDIPASITLHTDTKKAFYRVVIKDQDGEIVYAYPQHWIDNPQDFKLGNQRLALPASLRPSVYTIHAEVLYQFNPFKTGSVDFELATLNLK